MPVYPIFGRLYMLRQGHPCHVTNIYLQLIHQIKQYTLLHSQKNILIFVKYCTLSTSFVFSIRVLGSLLTPAILWSFLPRSPTPGPVCNIRGLSGVPGMMTLRVTESERWLLFREYRYLFRTHAELMHYMKNTMRSIYIYIYSIHRHIIQIWHFP